MEQAIKTIWEWPQRVGVSTPNRVVSNSYSFISGMCPNWMDNKNRSLVIWNDPWKISSSHQDRGGPAARGGQSSDATEGLTRPLRRSKEFKWNTIVEVCGLWRDHMANNRALWVPCSLVLRMMRYPTYIIILSNWWEYFTDDMFKINSKLEAQLGVCWFFSFFPKSFWSSGKDRQ